MTKRQQAIKNDLAELEERLPHLQWTDAIRALVESAWYCGSTYELKQQIERLEKK